VPGFGPTNDVLLGKQRLVSPMSATKRSLAGIRVDASSPVAPTPTHMCNLVVMGLVHLVARPLYRRSCYHAVLCLGNLSQDVLRCTPMYVEWIHSAAPTPSG
jgi:hypothetical protein